MSGGREITNVVGRVSEDPAIRAKATDYLTATGNADLLPALGLAEPEEAEVPDGDCPICGNTLPGHGVCRRRQACREAARERGESA